jgi:hypothetical protein
MTLLFPLLHRSAYLNVVELGRDHLKAGYYIFSPIPVDMRLFESVKYRCLENHTDFLTNLEVCGLSCSLWVSLAGLPGIKLACHSLES